MSSQKTFVFAVVSVYLPAMIAALLDIMTKCTSCVVLTGAGISAESGVPTFRGKDGLWGKFRAEELATMDAFMANPKIVWEWYNWRRQVLSSVKPNPGHYAISELEKVFDRFTLITQNVDGLHRQAGTVNILELHGNITRNKCVNCGCQMNDLGDIDPDNLPVCQSCGGKVRPDVVWFGEMLDPAVIDRAFEESEDTQLFFSVGTSAVVHPAASLPTVAKQRGATLVEINTEQTPLSYLADFHFSEKSGELLPRLVESLRHERTR